MDGREFLENNAGKGKICELMQASTDPCPAWELKPISEFSPGVVRDEEFLYRQVQDPTHYIKEKNEIKPTAFDDMIDKGMSVNRALEGRVEPVFDLGIKRAAKLERTLICLAEFKCADVRKITDDEGRRSLLVLDTALKDDPSHADICLILAGKRARRSVRGKLFSCVKYISDPRALKQASST